MQSKNNASPIEDKDTCNSEKIKVGEKYGGLTVLDDGTEYYQSETYLQSAQMFSSIKNKMKYLIAVSDVCEKQFIIQEQNDFSSQSESNDPDKINDAYSNFVKLTAFLSAFDLDDIKPKLEPHYKCICDCGRVHFFNESTLKFTPKYCYYPIPISFKSKSTKAANTAYAKRKKYEYIECVVLCEKSKCTPSEHYCAKYNTYKENQLIAKKKKVENFVAHLPRIYAKNYNVDFTGKQYESLLIECCCDDHFECCSNDSHHKPSSVIVYKRYKCKCTLCGKEQFITCDQFGIYPPTEYGYHAYHGYWSNVYCDCHPISSFQWIVCKLLIESAANYKVEYSFPDLYGISGKNLLRYDFAIFDSYNNIKCLLECQGEQHYAPIDEFGGETAYIQQEQNDTRKREYAHNNRIPLYEISYKNKRYDKVQKFLLEHGIIKKK